MATPLTIMQGILQLFIIPLRRLNANPVMVRTGRFHLVYFGLFAAMNMFLTASVFFYHLWLRGAVLAYPVALWMGVGALCIIFFARAYQVVVLGRVFFSRPGHYLRQTAFYNQGGIIGGLVALAVMAAVEGLGYLLLADGLAYGCVLGLVFGRLGCYNYGCCYGCRATGPLAVTYRNPRAKILRLEPALSGVPVMPVQLLTAYFNLAFFACLSIIIAVVPYTGVVTVAFFVVYNAFRLFMERYRSEKKETDTQATRKTALVLCCAGCVAAVVSLAMPTLFYETAALAHEFSLLSYLRFTFTDPLVLAPLLVLFCLTFIVYGYHGRELGSFA